MRTSSTIQYTGALNRTDRDLVRLLSAKNGAPNRPSLENATPADSPVEWQQIVERAAELSLSPLLFGAIRHSSSKNEIPVEIYQKLQGDYQLIALHNMLLYRKLHTILRLLQTHAITVIPIKGVFLAQVIYQDVGLRPMSDMDLLIHPQDRATVLRLMTELGFVASSERAGDLMESDLIENEVAELLKDKHHDRLTHIDDDLSLEIHWVLVKLNSHFQIDYDALWQRATVASIAGVPVYLLSPVDTLLHLCIHLCYQHLIQHYTLRGLCDIQHLITHYGGTLDWYQFCRLTEQWRAQRSAHLALFLAQTLFDVNVPSFVLQSLRPAQLDDRLYRWAIDRALGHVDDSVGPWSNNIARWNLATLWSQKLAIASQICFPPQQQLVDRLQASGQAPFLWVAYLRHWGKLARSLVARQTQPPFHVKGRTAVSWHERELGRTALIAWLHDQPEGAP